MTTIFCECCADNGERVTATWAAPSSPDAGKTVDFSPICDAHAEGWWDGADWDGRHLMQKLEHTYMGYFEISCLRILSRFLLMMNERRSVMKMLTMKNLRYSPGCYISPFHPDQP